MGEREKTRGREGPSKVSSFSFESVLLTWQTVLGMARSLILIGPCSGFVQQVVTTHPTPAGGAAHQGAEP